MARTELLAVLGLAASCGDSPGPLDRDVVHDLARDEGTAEGTASSGPYFGELQTLECGCPDLAELMPVSRCAVAGPSGDLVESVEVLQSDGVLVIRELGDTLTGAIEDDGSFSVGAIRDATTVATRGSILTRIDGTFVDDGFEGELRTRLVGEVVVLGEDTNGDAAESFDCVERLSMSLRRG